MDHRVNTILDRETMSGSPRDNRVVALVYAINAPHYS